MEYKLSRMSDCELLIMLCVWSEEDPVCVQQIQEKLKRYDKDYAQTTIYTIIKSLERKGFLSRKKKGTSYFTALVSKDDYKKELLDNVNLFFGDE